MRPRIPNDEQGVPLRRYLLAWVIGITALALAASAVPLTIAVQRLYRDEAITSLDHFAQGLQTVRPGTATGEPAAGAHVASPIIGLYGPGGDRFLGDGPRVSSTAALSRDGRIHDAIEDGQLTATAPLLHPDGTISVVRVGVPCTRIRRRTERAWALIAMAALLLLLLAAAAAHRIAGRATRPIEQIAKAVRRLGTGEPVRPDAWDTREARRTGQALQEAAERLEEIMARERSFSTDVAHQLRTPLTRLLLGLEAGLHRSGDPRTAIRTALGRGWSLVDTVEEMLQLARDDHARERFDLAALLRDVRDRRAPDAGAAGRALVLNVHAPLPPVHASPAALVQILDVLVDNALAHGAGTITVTAYHADPGLAIDVMDEGLGPVPGDDVFERRSPAAAAPRHRIGLALARSLARAESAHLYLSRTGPTVFTLLLPTAPAVLDDHVCAG